MSTGRADHGVGQRVFGTYLSGNDWTRFSSTLKSNNNAWSDATDTKKFAMPMGRMVDLRGWQGNTGEDMASTYSSAMPGGAMIKPPSACTVPVPSYTDFHVNVDQRSYAMSGGKAIVNLHVNSFGYGMVTLSVAGLPAGVTASYTTNALISGAPVLTLTASLSAVNQTVPITIVATSGSRVHTVNVPLLVAHM